MSDPSAAEAEKRRRIQAMLALTPSTDTAPLSPTERRAGSLFTAPDVEIGEARVESPLLDAVRAGVATEAAERPTASRARADRGHDALRRRAAVDAARERARADAYRRAPLTEGVAGDLMGISDEANAFGAGAVQGVTLGFADELAGVGRAALTDETYESARDASRARDDRAREGAPGWHAGGRALGNALPALALPGASAGTALGRVAQAGMYGGAFGGVDALGSSRGSVGNQVGDTARGAGYGFAFGAGGQALGEVGGAIWNRLTGEGRPRTLGPEARTADEEAQVLAEPDLRGMDYERREAARRAAIARIRGAAPDASPSDIGRTVGAYEGGPEALARDMDLEGLSPRGSVPAARDVQRRAQYAIDDAAAPPRPDAPRAPAAPDADQAWMDGVLADLRAPRGQFPDDDVVRGARRTVENPPPPTGRWTDDVLPDPADRVGPRPTYEQQLATMRAEDPAAWARELELDAQARAGGRRMLGEGPIEPATPTPANEAPLGATAPPGRRMQRARGASEPIVFSDGMGPPPTPPGARPLQAPYDRPRAPVPETLGADEPIDFGMMDAPEPRAQGGDFSDAHDARVRANILAAERRARRGGNSFSTHDERTWPVDLSRVEDITPPPVVEASPTQPPPLPPRRHAAPASPARPQVDLGTWEAPDVQPAPLPPRQASPAARTMRELGLRGEFARAEPLTGGLVDRAVQSVGRAVMRPAVRGRLDAAIAWAGEHRADALAREVAARLNARGMTPEAARLMAHARRGSQSIAQAVRAYSQTPEGERDVADAMRTVAPEMVPEDDQSLFTTPDGPDDGLDDYDPELF